MFIGHYAPALVVAALPRAPRLGALFVAAQLTDLAFFAFALLGIEHYRLTPGATVTNALDLTYLPYSHSLIGALGFAAAWAVGVRLAGGSHRAAWLGAAVVASHWPLDWLVHRPDLTLLGAGPRHGLGLWNWPRIEMPLELALVALALVFHASRTAPEGRGGRIALPVLALALLAAQFANWLTPQPAAIEEPAPASVSLAALATYAALALLAAGVTRTPIATPPSQTGPRRSRS
jgi:hypothetical protein